MSPTNWAVCPKCEKKRQEELSKKKELLHSQYGKTEANYWLAQREQLSVEKKKEAPETMRESYGMEMSIEGKFEVWYSASCDDCSFTFKFEHEEQANI